MDEDYELMPQSSFSKLKEDLENIKAKAAGSNDVGLNDNLKKLSDDLTTMIKLFQTATDEMKYEEQEAKLLTQKIDPLSDKIDMILEQNEQIAKGIVAVADLVKELKEKKVEVKPKPFGLANKPPQMGLNLNDDPDFPPKPLGMNNINAPPQMHPMNAGPNDIMRGPKMFPPPGMAPKPPMEDNVKPLMGAPLPPPPMPDKKKGFLGMFKK